MTAADLDTSILADLDFRPALPCEREDHAEEHVPDDPAAWWVTVVCYACGDTLRYALCDSGKNLMAESKPGGVVVYCDACGETAPWSHFVRELVRI